MASTKAKTTYTADLLDRFVGEIPPQDLIIMAAGAYAGSQGYTPLTAMISAIGGTASGVTELTRRVAQDPSWAIGAVVNTPGTLLAKYLFGGPDVSAEPVDKASMDAYKATLALSAIGLIESYTITRPGFAAGLMGLMGDYAKAAGEALPF